MLLSRVSCLLLPSHMKRVSLASGRGSVRATVAAAAEAEAVHVQAAADEMMSLLMVHTAILDASEE